MKVTGKITKTEILILALAAVFLAALGLSGVREARVGGDADYTVSTQRRAEGPVVPESEDPAEEEPQEPEQPAVVEINTAGPEELESLDGIGPALAQRIIDYREEHGPFQSAEDLLEVKGIGEATLEKLRDHITVEAPEDAPPEEPGEGAGE